MSYTFEQKKKLRKVLVKSVPKEASLEMLSELYDDLKASIPNTIDKYIEPHAKNILVLKDVLSDVPAEIEKNVTKLEEKTNKAIHDTNNKLSSTVSKLDREINLAISKIETRAEEEKFKLLSLEDKIKLLEKEVKDLWWSRKIPTNDGGKTVFLQSMNDVRIQNPTNGQILTYNNGLWINTTSGASGITLKTNGVNNGSQSILNLKQGTNISITDDGIGGVTINATGGSTTYSETPSGIINGSNVSFTTINTIHFVYGLYMNGQYIHPSDYSAIGTTITFNVAPDVSYSGLPFTIVYN